MHPGWRGRVPAGRVVVTDQHEARAWLDQMLDEELWRADRLRTSRAILLTLVEAMDWRTGLVTGATRDKAAQRAAVSTRTVSRVLAWAAQVGLLVCVEGGATAEFLGVTTNRAPAYVFTAQTGMPAPTRRRESVAHGVDKNGNPPASCVSTQTLAHEGAKRASQKRRAWPSRDRARDSQERMAATQTVLDRAGVRRVPAWKASAMLARWWRSDWSVAGLLYAIDHHPDRPGETRGDAIRGARDPLAVIGHRLAAWTGREHELPTSVQAVDPDERRRRAARLAEQFNEPAQQPRCTVSTTVGRQQARELFASAQRARRAAS